MSSCIIQHSEKYRRMETLQLLIFTQVPKHFNTTNLCFVEVISGIQKSYRCESFGCIVIHCYSNQKQNALERQAIKLYSICNWISDS
jgi:hypothetical protein